MSPTTIVMDDGTAVPLVSDHHGWYANHDGTLIHVTSVRTSLARTPATARWATD